ncbi:MAG TPA: magnesium transporter [Treponema sp.]|nr:magnesium transporter [Treponema sp.]
MMNELLAPDIETLVKENKYADVVQFLSAHHPTEDAELIADLKPEEIRKLLKNLAPQAAADIFCELPDALQSDTAELLSQSELTTMLEKLPPDERADLAKSIPESQLDAVLPFLAKKERDEIKELASYPEGTAGSVMTTDYIAFPELLTVQQAINRIRLEGAQKAAVSLIFMLDTERKLCGYVTLEDLILAKPLATLESIKKPLVAEITAEADREEASYKITKYGLIVLPVVDDTGSLIGIITHDDAMDVVEEERTEDMERFMAITGKHQDTSYLQTPALTQFSRRVIWLIILAFMDFISGAVLQSYQNTLSTLMLLAFYMPMLTDMGGNTGSQSATVIVRAIALKEVGPHDIFRVIWKELRISLMLGVVLGLIAFLRVELTGGSSVIPAALSLTQIGIAIGLALAVQVVSATIIGAVLPLLSSAFKFDPALIASPALTTIVDITGLLIYFGIARAMLHI